LGDAPWTRDPFGGEVAGGRVYGRGASDMKSGVAAIVVAACRHAVAGGAGPVEIVLTSAEETGLEGAAHLAGIRGSLGRAAALVVAEPTGNLPAFGNRGTVWLEITFAGRTAHASAPEHGINALLLAAEAAVKLAAHDLGGAPHPVLGRPTLTLSRLQAGSNFNSVPDRAVLGLDLRLLPAADIDAVIRDLAGLAGPAARLREVVRCPGLWTEPVDPWLAGALEVVAGINGRAAEQGAVPFNTDAAYLTPAYGGVPTLILGPGELAQAHQTDEWCEIAKIDQAVEIYLELMRRGGP
jgi:succinyl-diaminopimelate desuccinylase